MIQSHQEWGIDITHEFIDLNIEKEEKEDIEIRINNIITDLYTFKDIIDKSRHRFDMIDNYFNSIDNILKDIIHLL